MRETRYTIGEEMFKHLVKGQEVKIQQPDGSFLTFELDSAMGLDSLDNAIREAHKSAYTGNHDHHTKDHH